MALIMAEADGVRWSFVGGSWTPMGESTLTLDSCDQLELGGIFPIKQSIARDIWELFAIG